MGNAGAEAAAAAAAAAAGGAAEDGPGTGQQPREERKGKRERSTAQETSAIGTKSRNGKRCPLGVLRSTLACTVSEDRRNLGQG